MIAMDSRTSSSLWSRDDNQVFLRGRLAAAPVLRTLPSGDELCTFRLTVARPPGDRARVDSVDCASTRVRVRRSVERAEPGDELEVTGSLHRRFWRSPAGLGSRYEVAVGTARVSARQARLRQRTGA
jgi:single-strand DNA-binding protein